MGLKQLLFGAPLRSDAEAEERIGPVQGIPVLGLDALASASYGPEAALTVLLAAGAAARALADGRRWGRAPVITWQLLQLAVAVPGLRSDSPLVSAALLLASVVVLVGIFLPAVVRHTSTGGQPRTR